MAGVLVEDCLRLFPGLAAVALHGRGLRASGGLEEIIGGEALEMLLEALGEAVEGEARIALSMDPAGLEAELPRLTARFWATIHKPLLEAGEALLAAAASPGVLDEVARPEREAARELAGILRGTGYRRAGDLVRGLAALVDRDLWLTRWLGRLGPEGLRARLAGRGLRELLEFTDCTLRLLFAWTAAAAPLLGLIREYREDSRDALAELAGRLAGEVEDYIDTLDLLLDDEAYEDLVKMGVVKAG
ncbi:hypothetical protein [Stetteria hydrogenophila]